MLYALLFLTDSQKHLFFLLSQKTSIETAGTWELRKLLA